MRSEHSGAIGEIRGDERTFLLPLGYVDQSGRCHREAILRPITGREQQFLCLCSQTSSTAAVTTALLARCIVCLGEMREITPALVRELLVGDREFLLLRLYQMTFAGKIHVQLYCPAEACAEVTEILLDLDQITLEADQIETSTFTIKLNFREERTISFRLPTGADQEALISATNLTEEQQSEALIRRCLLGEESAAGALTRRECEEVENRMKTLAPLIEVELEATCPKCSGIFSHHIDLPWLILSEIRSREAALEQDIHSLAFYYHWPESEIMSLTPRMRTRYVDLLDLELERIAN
jgi:hypothetical protein